MHLTRRAVLGTGAAALVGASTAGCLGEPASGTDESPAQASFFLLYDLADRIAGEDQGVESVVPFGQHGHGWEPSGQVQQAIYDAPLFAYVGEGFQPWADDIVANLAADDADVVVTAVWEGIDLIGTDGHGEEGHEEEESHDDHDESQDEAGDDGHEEEHDHANRDPHFWLDPVRTRRAVDNLRDGLVQADSDNEEAYRDRATSLKSGLQNLHQTFESRLAEATHDRVLVAGHNAFRYASDRYDFEIHALSGISPDEEPSARARREAADFVAEHGIEYILTPALEPRRATEQLVEETDAVDYLEISALSGLKDEWREDGWGYLEVMEQVNLPALERALGAT